MVSMAYVKTTIMSEYYKCPFLNYIYPTWNCNMFIVGTCDIEVTDIFQ